MATMKVPYNGSWVTVQDPTAERLIYKNIAEPTSAVEGSLWIDTSDDSNDLADSAGIAAAISLSAGGWSDGLTSDHFVQTVSIPGVTADYRVDLMPMAENLNAIFNSGSALSVSNDNGVLTCNCFGNKPTENLEIPVCLVKIDNTGDLVVTGNQIGAVTQWGRW